MSEDRKRPGWIFWTTVTIVVVVIGYPLSMGPVTWVVSRDLLPWGALDCK